MDVYTTLMIIGVATVAGETVIRVCNSPTISLQPWRRSSRTLQVRRPNSANFKIDWTLPSGC
jgi:hypothetical protein